MSAFLRPGCLILDMYTCCSLFDEQFGQFHYGCQPSVTGISVCNDGSQEICISYSGAIRFGCIDPLFSLFAIMKELGHEELLDFVRYSVLE